jgi:GTP-binding protein YchF
MECGIVGPPQSGKTTLFSLLTGAHESAHGKREVQRGVSKLPDPRIEKLAEVSASRKIVHATVEYVDVPGVAVTPESREPYPPGYLAELRGASMLMLVIRDFEAPGIPHPRGKIDPSADLADAALEFIVNDLSTVEKRLSKISKMHDPASKKETELLERCQAALTAEKHLREVEFTAEEEKVLRGYAFLSLKPLLVVLNLGEEGAVDADARIAKLRASAGDMGRHIGWAACAAEIEAEIAKLDEAERAPFMEELGFKLPALERIVRATFDLLGMITFFTTGDKDTTAWAIRRGSNAVIAAGAIHDDIARGFIRAEVFQWNEFVAVEGHHVKLKESGKLRLEGKEYIVQDGDVINVRFSI